MKKTEKEWLASPRVFKTEMQIMMAEIEIMQEQLQRTQEKLASMQTALDKLLDFYFPFG